LNIPERLPSSLRHLETFCKYCVSLIGNNSIFVEIGSWTGISTILFAKYFKTVIAIDPWEKTIDEISSQYNMEEVEKIFDLRIKEFSNIKKLKMKSKEASLLLFEDNSINIVYIDGSHKYDAVKEDIKLWYPKIKIGGLLTGHDYSNKFLGVKKAIDESIKNIKIFGETSWLYRKVS
jgi:predicted O-methyltransferase YrrM